MDRGRRRDLLRRGGLKALCRPRTSSWSGRCNSRPDVDVVTFVSVDDRSGRRREAYGRFFHPTVQCTMRLPGMRAVAYSGLHGLRDAWRDWLKNWASYRVETEDVIDGGERVAVVHRSVGRPRPGAPEVTRRRATVWTVRDGRVASVDFNVPYREALAAVGLAK